MVLTAQEEMLVKFFGKASGHIKGPGGPGTGELNPDVVMDGLSAVLGVARPSRSDVVVDPEKDLAIPARDLTFCAGCPHRASFFAAEPLEIDGRQGVVMGDIGCYTMGGAKAGHFLLSSLFCMGGRIGMASGMGKWSSLGLISRSWRWPGTQPSSTHVCRVWLMPGGTTPICCSWYSTTRPQP